MASLLWNDEKPSRQACFVFRETIVLEEGNGHFIKNVLSRYFQKLTPVETIKRDRLSVAYSLSDRTPSPKCPAAK